jgi:hypothetical protein
MILINEEKTAQRASNFLKNKSYAVSPLLGEKEECENHSWRKRRVFLW